jgi:hypothetical protein
VPERSTRQLAGLMSRWTRPPSCACCRPFHHALKVLPLHVLHHDVVRVVLVVDIVRTHDVRMVQRRHRSRFQLETLQVARLADPRLRQHLDGHRAAHDRVFRQIDAAHASRAQVALERVLAESKAAVLALGQLLRLPSRQQPCLRHARQQVLRREQKNALRTTRTLTDESSQVFLADQLAPLHQLDQAFGREDLRHGSTLLVPGRNAGGWLNDSPATAGQTASGRRAFAPLIVNNGPSTDNRLPGGSVHRKPRWQVTRSERTGLEEWSCDPTDSATMIAGWPWESSRLVAVRGGTDAVVHVKPCG